VSRAQSIDMEPWTMAVEIARDEAIKCRLAVEVSQGRRSEQIPRLNEAEAKIVENVKHSSLELSR
jgi:hypothetical protein